MNEKSMQKERLHWVDAAKGILIVLVAMVHVIGRGDELGIACPAIGKAPITQELWSGHSLTFP